MFNKKNILFLFSIALIFVLFGCGNKNQNPSVNNKGNDSNKTIETGGQVIKVSEELDKCKSSELKDQCLQTLADVAGDINICDSITDEKSKNFCKDTVAYNKAIKDNDVSSCQNIKDANKKDYCLDLVISQNNNLDYCDKNDFITKNNLKDKCQSVILTQQAWNNKDSSLCDKIPLDPYKKTCLDEGFNTKYIDSDNDSLTDEQEKIYGTDPKKADTDGDGYKDGDEVIHGYDPLVPGSARLKKK